MPQALRLGDTGPEVSDLRARLTRLGLLCDDVSDAFDATVDRAVRHFQQERGLTIDGIAGTQTLRHLEEARWQLGDRALSYTPGHLMRGDDVQALQRRLTSLGFNVNRIDGIFGASTDAALREFQRGVGVSADGTSGVQTFRALERLGRSIVGGRPERLRQHVLLDSLRTGISDKVIVLDPSNGSDAPGNVMGNLIEAALVGDLATRVEGRLAALGTTVLLTRPAHGPALTDAERANFANETGADLFVSLHIDACAAPDACGLASFHYGVAQDAGWSHSGERAARRIHQAILAAEPLADCRVQNKTWELLRLTKMPAVWIEPGYLTNPDDAARWADPIFIDRLAEAIAEGIVAFFTPA
jgi:N-acetylmuramoyl-L-alanine amidase